MRAEVFDIPRPDGVGAFSCETNYGPYVCYRHLQGDMCYVAENVTAGGKREFFRTAEELQLWVEAQPKREFMLRVRPGYYTWKVAI